MSSSECEFPLRFRRFLCNPTMYLFRQYRQKAILLLVSKPYRVPASVSGGGGFCRMVDFLGHEVPPGMIRFLRTQARSPLRPDTQAPLWLYTALAIPEAMYGVRYIMPGVRRFPGSRRVHFWGLLGPTELRKTEGGHVPDSRVLK